MCLQGGFRFFIKARANRRAVPPHMHPEFIVLSRCLQAIRARRPRGGILEQVMGFASPLQGEDSDGRPLPYSWAAWASQQLVLMGYKVQALRMDHESWSEFPRPRTCGSAARA
jgi:hypothetical protein